MSETKRGYMVTFAGATVRVITDGPPYCTNDEEATASARDTLRLIAKQDGVYFSDFPQQAAVAPWEGHGAGSARDSMEHAGLLRELAHLRRCKELIQTFAELTFSGKSEKAIDRKRGRAAWVLIRELELAPALPGEGFTLADAIEAMSSPEVRRRLYAELLELHQKAKLA